MKYTQHLDIYCLGAVIIWCSCFRGCRISVRWRRRYWSLRRSRSVYFFVYVWEHAGDVGCWSLCWSMRATNCPSVPIPACRFPARLFSASKQVHGISVYSKSCPKLAWQVEVVLRLWAQTVGQLLRLCHAPAKTHTKVWSRKPQTGMGTLGQFDFRLWCTGYWTIANPLKFSLSGNLKGVQSTARSLMPPPA